MLECTRTPGLPGSRHTGEDIKLTILPTGTLGQAAHLSHTVVFICSFYFFSAAGHLLLVV